MAKAPIGANVYLYIDAAQVLDVGDLVVTGTGRCYRVTANRIQQRGMRAGRQHLRCDVVDYEQAMAERTDERVQEIAWYRRG